MSHPSQSTPSTRRAFIRKSAAVAVALLRLEQKGWIKSDWGTSENNRRARFYAITAAGRRQLTKETALWARTVSMMNRLLEDQS